MLVGDFGRILVYLAVACFALSAAAGLFNRSYRSKRSDPTDPTEPTDQTAGRLQGWVFTAGCLCLFATIVCLGSLFVADQFHYKYVHDRGDVSTDLKYKI